MANTVIELRHSYVTGNVPASLANGEIAINTYDGKIFYRGGASNTIQTIERYTGPAGLDKEIQFNDSGVLGANSGLTFDKSTGALTVSGNVTTSQYFIGDGSKLTGLAPALQIYSLANTASGVSDYMVLKSLANYTVGTQNTTSRTVTTTPTLLTSFITDVGFPNITTIPSGDIVIEFDTTKASGVGGYYCYAEIYKRTSGGVETLLTTTENTSSSTLNTTIQQRVNKYVSAPISLDLTDRLVVKIYAVMLTTSASISISFDGAADGAFTIPTFPASVLSFVPYLNATANVYLNSYSLLADTVTANSVVVANSIIVGGRDLNAYANAAFLQANTPSHVANSASSYANSAFLTANAALTRANNSLNANTGGTVTGTITADSFITTGSYGNIQGANLIYANTFIANSGGYIQFADGTKQYTANAGSGGGEASYLKLTNTSIIVDGATANVWSGSFNTNLRDVYAGVYNPNNSTALFTFSSNSSNVMSVQMDGSMFVGDSWTTDALGVIPSYSGWIVASSGIKSVYTVYAGSDVQAAGRLITGNHIEFSDGSKQYTANAGSSNSFGRIYASNNSTFANASVSTDRVDFIGENGISVVANSTVKSITFAATPGIQGISVDYGFVYDAVTYSIDYGTL